MKQPAIHLLDSRLRDRQIVVHLAGAGGTGSQVLTGLARLHLALLALGHPDGLHVLVFDPDRVSPANIGRQLFAPSDVGQSKAVTLVHRLNCYFGLQWKAFCDPYTGEQAQSADILITAVDSAKARRDIAKGLVENTPGSALGAVYPYWLDMGNARRTGQVYLTRGGRQTGPPVTVARTPQEFGEALLRGGEMSPPESAPLPALWEIPILKEDIFNPDAPEDDTPSCSLAESLGQQDLFINQHMAGWGLHLLWQLLNEGQLTTHGYWINLEDGRVTPVHVPSPEMPKPARRGRKACVNG